MIKDDFDKQFGDIDFLSDADLKEHNRRVKIANSRLGTSLSEETKNKLRETYASDEMKAVQASKSKPHTEEAKEKIRNANLGLKHNATRVEKMASRRKGQAVYHKCFSTPGGAFPSKKSAIEWATENGVGNASGKFDKWIRERPEEFYYITTEEYELIKDNPKQTGLSWMENTKRLKKYRGVEK
jgi:hypothetical protein